MKYRFDFSALAFNILMCVLLACVATTTFGQIGLLLTAVLFGLGLIPGEAYPTATLHDEVIRRVFAKAVAERIWPDNTFYEGAQFDEGIAETAETVEIPLDEDGEADSVENPTEFPLKIVQSATKKKTYEVDLVATLPERIADVRKALLVPDLRAVKVRKHTGTLQTRIADKIMYAWTPTNEEWIRGTTGDARSVSGSNGSSKAPGRTGDRLRVTLDDILWAFGKFEDYDLDTTQARMVIPAYMYVDFLKIPEFIDLQKLRMKGDVAAGQIGEVLGMKVYRRSKTTIFDNDGVTKKPFGAEIDNSDCQSILIFHPEMVRYCKGNVQAYYNPGQGTMLGDTMNFAIRAGGCITRESELGALSIVESND